MASYKDLLAQKAELEEKIEAARQTEITAAIQHVKQIIIEYGLTAEDLGLATRNNRQGFIKWRGKPRPSGRGCRAHQGTCG